MREMRVRFEFQCSSAHSATRQVKVESDPLFLWVGALLLCVFARAALAEPTLTVAAGGRTAIYTPTGLLAWPAATTVTIPADFAYKRSMTFRVVPMATLLAGTAADENVRIVAADGFKTLLPAAALLARGAATAYLAIEAGDAAWPALKAGCPQQVWPSGKTTSTPTCSSTSTVAAATSS